MRLQARDQALRGVDGCGITLYASTFPMHPVRMGYRPVCGAARDGVHMGAAETHWVNFLPEETSLSICGVIGRTESPRPKSP